MEKVLIRDNKTGEAGKAYVLFGQPHTECVKIGDEDVDVRLRECYGMLYYPGCEGTHPSIFRCSCMFSGTLDKRYDSNVILKAKEIARQLLDANQLIMECTVCKCDSHGGCAQRRMGSEEFNKMMKNLKTSTFFCSEACKTMYERIKVNKELLAAKEELEKITEKIENVSLDMLDPVTGEPLIGESTKDNELFDFPEMELPDELLSCMDVERKNDDLFDDLPVSPKKKKTYQMSDNAIATISRPTELLDIPHVKSAPEELDRKVILYYNLCRAMVCSDNCLYAKLGDPTVQANLSRATASVKCACCGEQFHTECHGYKKGNGKLYSKECFGAHIYCSRPQCMDYPIGIYISDDVKKQPENWISAYERIPSKHISKLSRRPKNPEAIEAIAKHVFVMVKREYNRRASRK